MTETDIDPNGPIFGDEHFAQRLLNRFRALESWEEFQFSPADFKVNAKLNVDDFESEQIAGLVKVSNASLLSVLEKVHALKNEALVDRSLQEAKLYFDNSLAKSFHTIFPMAPSQAAKIEVWLYLSVRLFPEIISWRWADSSGKINTEDRIFAHLTDRHALARLWWQSALLAPEFLVVKGDTRDQISERGRTLLSRPKVSNSILKWFSVSGLNIANESEIIKQAASQLTKAFALIPVDLLSEEEVESMVFAVMYALDRSIDS
jgi:hypothetical protein